MVDASSGEQEMSSFLTGQPSVSQDNQDRTENTEIRSDKTVGRFSDFKFHTAKDSVGFDFVQKLWNFSKRGQ
jgi:hypothetical protein